MNRLSNYSKLGVMSVMLVTLFGMTPQVGAVSARATTSKESAFCTNLAANISKIDTSIASLESKLSASRSTRDQTIVNDHAKWDQQLQDNRSKWDQQRQDSFAKLEARAKTAAQSAAVKTYEATIISAINARRSANDTARVTYRSGVESTLAAQRSTVDGQVAVFSSAVSNAEATAQSGCQTTPGNGPALRVSFQSSLKSARENYAMSRKGGDVSSQIKQLVTTRDASFKTNDATCKVTTDNARDTLKASFGSNA